MRRRGGDNGDITMRKNTISTLNALGAATLALVLAACGSGLSANGSSSSSSGGGSTGPVSGGGTPTSIEFISATPPSISLQGVGGITASKVIFQVNDKDGNPVPGITVDFTLSTTAGGILLNPTSGTTGTDGQAFTFVQSGTVHTSVNITASIPSTSISFTTPNAIAIGTGIPSQTHFSLAVASHNVQGYNHDGTVVAVSVRLADRYGNPVTPGTHVLFSTNGGHIDGNCFTDTTGFCTVNWVSQDPRPLNDTLDVAGHAHILAYTEGEEHYTDNNNDNVFDNGDTFSLCGTCTTPGGGDTFFDGTTLVNHHAPAFDDMGDPYMDSKETGQYILGEDYVDLDNANNVPRRAPNGKWYGAGCGGFGTTTATVSVVGPTGTITCANTQTMIGKDDCIVMSTDGVIFGAPSQTLIDHTAPPPGNSATFTLEDGNHNVIASGSTVTLVADIPITGVTVQLVGGTGGTTITQPDQGCTPPGSFPAVQTYTVTVIPITGSLSFSGSFHLLYTSADGKTTQQSASVSID